MISQGKPSLIFSEVRNVVKDEQIVSRYFGVKSIPAKISSPLRRDSNPSLGIFSPDGKSLLYKDFGTGERGDIFNLLMKLWHTDYKGVCERVYKDFQLEKAEFKSIIREKSTYRPVKIYNNSDLKVKVREWRSYDIEYWNSYGISLEWLKYADVYPISHKIVYKNNQRYVYGADKYAYAYIEHKEGKTTMKIYQPFNKNGFKWSSKHDRSVISLWTKVPQKGKVLCICSSLKDALCLSANTGIPAIATQGEGYSISETAIKSLKERYERVYILYDNDPPGLADGKKLAEETGFTNLILPKINEAKDISDFYKSLKDKKQFKQTILKLFANGNS